MTFVGQPVKRFEDPRLLTGQGSYVDDLTLPGLLHAVVLRSLHAHANIRSIDVSAASRVPGVVAVFTAADIQDLAVEIPTRTNTGADEFSPPRHPVLASDKVCYVGQAVAVVIAEDAYRRRCFGRDCGGLQGPAHHDRPLRGDGRGRDGRPP